jgi:hypothetical protein
MPQLQPHPLLGLWLLLLLVPKGCQWPSQQLLLLLPRLAMLLVPLVMQLLLRQRLCQLILQLLWHPK